MTSREQRIVAAEARAKAARRRLTATIGDIQDQLNPALIAREAARDLADASAVVARKSVQTVRRNPLAVAGAAAAIGLIVARHRIVGLVRRKP